MLFHGSGCRVLSVLYRVSQVSRALTGRMDVLFFVGGLDVVDVIKHSHQIGQVFFFSGA